VITREDLNARGLVQPKAPFGGHSLGEYAALASVADVLPISALIEVVFYRGLTMNRAVKRDEGGRSNFSMMVNRTHTLSCTTHISLTDLHPSSSPSGRQPLASAVVDVVRFNPSLLSPLSSLFSLPGLNLSPSSLLSSLSFFSRIRLLLLDPDRLPFSRRSKDPNGGRSHRAEKEKMS
jgi:hypothetical protein